MKSVCLFVIGLFSLFAFSVFAEDSELVALAKKEKERRAKVEAKKTFTNQDISKIKDKQLGIEAGSSSSAETEKTEGKEEAAEEKDDTEGEEYWRQRREAVQARVEAAQAKVDELQTDVNALTRAYYDAATNYGTTHPMVESERAARMGDLEAAQKELADARAELEGLEDEARRAGVPPGWVR